MSAQAKIATGALVVALVALGAVSFALFRSPDAEGHRRVGHPAPAVNEPAPETRPDARRDAAARRTAAPRRAVAGEANRPKPPPPVVRGPRKLFDVIAARTADERSGTQDGYDYLGCINKGDWVKYDDVDLGPADEPRPISFVAVVSCPPQYAGNEIEVHLNARDGPVIATLTVESTGGHGTFVGQVAPVARPARRHARRLPRLQRRRVQPEEHQVRRRRPPRRPTRSPATSYAQADLRQRARPDQSATSATAHGRGTTASTSARAGLDTINIAYARRRRPRGRRRSPSASTARTRPPCARYPIVITRPLRQLRRPHVQAQGPADRQARRLPRRSPAPTGGTWASPTCSGSASRTGNPPTRRRRRHCPARDDPPRADACPRRRPATRRGSMPLRPPTRRRRVRSLLRVAREPSPLPAARAGLYASGHANPILRRRPHRHRLVSPDRGQRPAHPARLRHVPGPARRGPADQPVPARGPANASTRSSSRTATSTTAASCRCSTRSRLHRPDLLHAGDGGGRADRARGRGGDPGGRRASTSTGAHRAAERAADRAALHAADVPQPCCSASSACSTDSEDRPRQRRLVHVLRRRPHPRLGVRRARVDRGRAGAHAALHRRHRPLRHADHPRPASRCPGRSTSSSPRAPTATPSTRRWSEVGPQLLDAVKYCIEHAAAGCSCRRSRSGGRRRSCGTCRSSSPTEQIPPIPIFVDSPMGVEVSQVHSEFRDNYDERDRRR